MGLPQAEMLPATFVGLEMATARYQAAARNPDSTAETVFIPLSEALAWACSLDEALKKLHGQAYRQARAADRVAPYLMGLRYARNRCTHELALVADRGHLAPPLRPPITPGLLFRWRPITELPGADDGHNNGENEYRDYLASDTAESTLKHVTDWLLRAYERFV